MKQPSTTTTTTTEMWQWQWQCGRCRADWKMLRQVTTCCPHGDGGRCCQGQGTLPPPSPSAGSPAPHCQCHHHHRHRHRHEELQGTSSRALAAGAEGSSNADAGRRHAIATLNPAPPVVAVAVAELCWVPDPYLMVQQLREFEPLNDDELVALRVQLQEYAEEIDKSTRRDISAGTGGMNMNWLLALPANVRDVVIMARDVIESFIAISTSAPPANLE